MNKLTQEGIYLIKKFEGLKLNAYRCPSGVLTIGYGHTYNVKTGDKITQEEAYSMLLRDLSHFCEKVSNLVKKPLNNYQFSALVSFAYNCGLGALTFSSLLKKINGGDYISASKEFLRWDKGPDGKPLPGLTTRRKAEQELFNKKVV
jgi:lysozyme